MRVLCVICGESNRGSSCERCGGRVANPALLEPGVRGSPIAEYVTGIRLALRGIRMTLASGRLLAMIAVPLVINVALFVALAWFLISRTNEWLPAFEQPFWTGFDWLRPAVRFVVVGLADVLALIAASIAMLAISTVVNAPFLEWLSEAVETLVIGAPDPRPLTPARMYRIWIHPVIQAAVLAVFQAGLGLLLLAASFSGVLSPVAPIGNAWLLALALVDVVIARKGRTVRDRFAVLQASIPVHLGVATPLVFVPFLLPLFVPGATLAYLRDLRAGAEKSAK